MIIIWLKYSGESRGGLGPPPLEILKVIEKCTNFYFGAEKLPPKF